MKKGFIFVLALLLIPAFLFATGQQSTSGSASTAKREFSMSLMDRGNVPASEGTMTDNRWTRWINDNSPVKVTFIAVPRSGSRDHLTALYAAGTNPDVIWEYNKVTLDTFYSQGVIQPVGDYINQYSTTYKKYMQDNLAIFSDCYGPDGKQYGFTSKRMLTSLPNQSIFVRKDWLDKFGMQLPVTIDDALAFMRKAKAENPSGHPQGTWGVGTDYTWGTMATSYFGRPADNFLIVNGHYVDWYSTDGYRDALDYMRTCYMEGLIDPEYITDSPNYTRQKQFMTTGRIAMRFQGMGFEGDYKIMKENVPTADFVPIDPLTTKYGKFGFGIESPYLKMCLMSKSCKDPQAVMQYLDWMITPAGFMTMMYGIEGRHYRLVNGVPQVIDAALNRVEVDYIKGNAEFILVDNLPMTSDWIPLLFAQDAISQDWAKRYQLAVQKGIGTPSRSFVPYGPTSDRISAYNTATSGDTTQVYALEISIITGKLTLDEGLRQINAYKTSQGWDAVNKEKDDWYQANKNLPQFANFDPTAVFKTLK